MTDNMVTYFSAATLKPNPTPEELQLLARMEELNRYVANFDRFEFRLPGTGFWGISTYLTFMLTLSGHYKLTETRLTFVSYVLNEILCPLLNTLLTLILTFSLVGKSFTVCVLYRKVQIAFMKFLEVYKFSSHIHLEIMRILLV